MEIRVLYDHQAFRRTRYSGIPKYFAELIHTFYINNMVHVSLVDSYCMNVDYQNLFPSKKGYLSLLEILRVCLLSLSKVDRYKS